MFQLVSGFIESDKVIDNRWQLYAWNESFFVFSQCSCLLKNNTKHREEDRTRCTMYIRTVSKKQFNVTLLLTIVRGCSKQTHTDVTKIISLSLCVNQLTEVGRGRECDSGVTGYTVHSIRSRIQTLHKQNRKKDEISSVFHSLISYSCSRNKVNRIVCTSQ